MFNYSVWWIILNDKCGSENEPVQKKRQKVKKKKVSTHLFSFALYGLLLGKAEHNAEK